MLIRVPAAIREAFGLAPARDEGLLAGPGEGAVRDLGAAAPVLSLFPHAVAALCPELVHEAQWSLSHHD